MGLNKTYSFNLPWRGVVAATGLYVGLAYFMAHKAKAFTGVVFVGLIGLSVMFSVLACIMMTRRLFFPRVLVLTGDAVLIPRGFPKTRIVPILYIDIIRIWDISMGDLQSLGMATAKGRFEIVASHFPNISDYDTVRDFIATKVAPAMTAQVETESLESKRWREFPDPILRWMEPDDWPRYRTLLFTSQPLIPRLLRAMWFCGRCFGIIILPWLALLLCGVATSPARAYLSLALAVTLFFTLLHWLSAAHPVHRTQISFRDNGITQFFGKQIMDHNYDLFSGWAIVERPFEGRALHILLLRWPYGVRAFALPDAEIKDRLEQIFHVKGVPQDLKLRPSWE